MSHRSSSISAADSRVWLQKTLAVVLICACIFACCETAEAGPGGQFVKQALSTKFGRIGGLVVGGLLLIAAIILFPLIAYAYLAERAGIRHTKRDLAKLATKYPWYDWDTFRKRVNQTVRKIADVWATGDLSPAAKFMTSDYFASQQQLVRRWHDEGKQIVYKLDKVNRIEPLAVRVEDEQTWSWIRVLVNVDCVDYMRDESTREVIKGEAGKTNGFECVYCFVYQQGEWLLNGIEKGSTSLTWATTKNQVDTTWLDYARAKETLQRRAAEFSPTSQPAALDAAADEPAAGKKQRLVRKPARDEQE